MPIYCPEEKKKLWITKMPDSKSSQTIVLHSHTHPELLVHQKVQ